MKLIGEHGRSTWRIRIGGCGHERREAVTNRTLPPLFGLGTWLAMRLTAIVLARMIPIADIIADGAAYFGITRGEFAQVLASLLGSACAVGAAVAAWRAADSTAKSVREMREARLQSVRPSLVLSCTPIGYFQFYRDRAPALVADAAARDARAVLRLLNAGTGPACDVAISVTHEADWWLSQLDVEVLTAFFRQGGWTVTSAEPLHFTVRKHRAEQSVLNVQLEASPRGNWSGSASVCRENEDIEFGIQDFGGIGSAALKTIAAGTGRWDRWIVQLSYRSTANEAVARRFELSIWFAYHEDARTLGTWDVQSVHCIPSLRDVTHETRWSKAMGALRERMSMYFTGLRLALLIRKRKPKSRRVKRAP